MVRVALVDADWNGGRFPNLALMKLSAWHKSRGDDVSLVTPIEAAAPSWGKVYVSKIFTFTPMPPLPDGAEAGGSGVSLARRLPEDVEHVCPDYELYSLSFSLGFLTRGCPRRCPWCVVPEKEGGIRAHADFQEFVRHKDVVLLDNNILASPHGTRQLEGMAAQGLRVDVTQGLDARLVGEAEARLLAKVRWLKPIRLACDSADMIPFVERAAGLLRKHGATPKDYSVYVLVGDDVGDALERVMFLKGLGLRPFAQPYRGFGHDGGPSREQRLFARWVNHRATFYSCSWDEYRPRTTGTMKRKEQSK
jgi:hypothetical protein